MFVLLKRGCTKARAISRHERVVTEQSASCLKANLSHSSRQTRNNARSLRLLSTLRSHTVIVTTLNCRSHISRMILAGKVWTLDMTGACSY